MYVAVMVCMPEASVEVLNFAASPLTATVFRRVAPSKKVTVPVTLPLNCGATLAVKVTDWLKLEGFTEDISKTVVVALLTVWVVVPVAGPSFVSPP